MLMIHYAGGATGTTSASAGFSLIVLIWLANWLAGPVSWLRIADAGPRMAASTLAIASCRVGIVSAFSKGTSCPSATAVLTLILSLILSFFLKVASSVRLSSATLLAPHATVVGPAQISLRVRPMLVNTRRARLFLTMC